MKIEIPKIVMPIELSEYAPEMAGQHFYIWVNPPMEKLQAYNNLVLQLQTQGVEEARQNLFPAESSNEKKNDSALRKTYELVNRYLSFKKKRKPDGIDQRLLEWYAEVWSQGPVASQWTVDELRIVEGQDPAFLSWMITRTWSARAEHMERKKKA